MDTSNDIIFVVDETSDLPIWAQLRNRIAYLIRTNHFLPGEQLPSVRSLASEARINYNTVAKAYRDLELSGLIVSIRGRGMFVQKDACSENPELEAADALVESGIRQYRGLGLTYKDVRERVRALIDELETRTQAANEEKRSYGAE